MINIEDLYQTKLTKEAVTKQFWPATWTSTRGPVATLSPRADSAMQKQKYCVYNQTKESFLSLGVAAADTTMARLKGLMGKLTLGLDEGLWMVPSRGIHTLGVLFPLDLVYLDDSY